MKNWDNVKIGISFRREQPPEKLIAYAKRAENAGFDELWVAEDCFYASGIAAAAAALANTNKISVGVGIIPAVARNPVFTTMEIATLARMYPGRFTPGIGHGVARWMKQIGAFPKSQLAALEEAVVISKRLLAGEEVEFDGRQFQLDQGKLIHPPAQIPPIYLGVRGPKSLAISGRIANGTILAEFSSPAYVNWAKDHIEKGKGDERDHHITVFVFACACASLGKGREQIHPLVAKAIASGRKDMHFEPMGIIEYIRELRKINSYDEMASRIPDAWIDHLAIIGNSEDWKQSIERYIDAGADTVVLVPLPNSGLDQLDIFAQQLSH